MFDFQQSGSMSGMYVLETPFSEMFPAGKRASLVTLRVCADRYLPYKRVGFTQFLTPTHAQLQRHRLKLIKKPYKNSYMFRSTTIFREFTNLIPLT